ncbi:FecR family protein [Limibacterium fermenti]|uniref:FecR family protein n=1 Tax=Limibacterium fermenti TaxID=3229863 RepID=UPI000E87BC29|nr:hypothetical protein [Porphyromonadaceae bacterium]
MEDRILKYVLGELNTSEKAALRKQLEADKSLKEEFIRIQNTYALTLLSEQAINKQEGQKHFDCFLQQLKHQKRRRIIKTTLQYAAIVALLIASTVLATLHFSTSETPPLAMNSLHVPAGQRAQLTLSDGTVVWLNAQSTFTYPSQFKNNSREVKVIGEAFFDVAKDAKKPFIVSSQNIKMEVLGTQFNVYSYPENEYIQTDLVEGSLKIVQRDNEKNTTILKPNEQMIIRDGKMHVNDITDYEHFLWKEGIYCFQNERLIDILKKLELYYDVEIIVKDPGIFNVRYTGKFRQRDGIDEILRIIRKVKPFKINRDIENNRITITK